MRLRGRHGLGARPLLDLDRAWSFHPASREPLVHSLSVGNVPRGLSASAAIPGRCGFASALRGTLERARVWLDSENACSAICGSCDTRLSNECARGRMVRPLGLERAAIDRCVLSIDWHALLAQVGLACRRLWPPGPRPD